MSHLADRAVISLSGPEARNFLQGLITNDVNLVAPDKPVYAALLTPQGKVLFDFLIWDADGALLIDCPRGGRDALVKRLSLYKLRAKVDIAVRDDLAVIVGDGVPDPRLATLPKRQISPATSDAADDDGYLASRLELGVPEGADFGSDRTFALDAGLDELHAISFTKGCYVGQELTARMKHRGTDRKRLLRVDAAEAMLETGMTIAAGDKEIGTILSSYGTRGFALVRLDRLSETDTAALHAGPVPVRVTKPAWLSA